jgi:CheY-like chemotaxis protein
VSERCVLLVEDSPAAATIAKYALAAGGVRVEHCATLGAALARLADPERPRPSAVVLDLTLPDSSGVETFDRLAAAGPPPVVVLSGDDDPSQALALIERGAQDYLVKGENSGPAIARSVRQAIERGRLQEAERRSGRAVPIVAITADTQEDQRTACLDAGCGAHLGKPFTQDDLGVLERFLPPARAPSPAEPGDAPRAQIPPEMADLAEQYLRNRCTDAETLREAAGAGDFAEARRRGHNMKGSGTGYGFPHVSQLGARIERAAEARDAGELQRCADALFAYAEKELAGLD